MMNGGNFTKDGITYDPSGSAFIYPELRLPKEEYARVISGINTVYETRYKGRETGVYYTSEHCYRFEIHGFDVYNIYYRE